MPSKKPLERRWVAGIFKKLQARYGHRWTSAIEGIEETAVIEWGQCLAGLDADQIRRGLDEWDDDWPPSAPSFRKACVGRYKFDPGSMAQIYEGKRIPKERRISNGVRDPEQAKEKLGEIRQMLAESRLNQGQKRKEPTPQNEAGSQANETVTTTATPDKPITGADGQASTTESSE